MCGKQQGCFGYGVMGPPGWGLGEGREQWGRTTGAKPGDKTAPSCKNLKEGLHGWYAEEERRNKEVRNFSGLWKAG